jgi:hypothetical protein
MPLTHRPHTAVLIFVKVRSAHFDDDLDLWEVAQQLLGESATAAGPFKTFSKHLNPREHGYKGGIH